MTTTPTPRSLGYRLPAEWEPHVATWLSWPHNVNSWPGKFEPVPPIWAELTRVLTDGEEVHIAAGPGPVFEQASTMVGGLKNVTIHPFKTNDAWMRDHGPMFLAGAGLEPAVVDWGYNAWGGKYPPFEDDNKMPANIADFYGMKRFDPGMILEGGSIEPNGKGTLLTTSQCLLNPNRNPEMTKEQIEQKLRDFACIDQILWLGEPYDGSIPGDDTDAHIDQLARFVSETTVLAAYTEDTDDEAYWLLNKNYEQLKSFRLPDGRPLDVVKFPMPDPQYYDDQRLPMSYANFYIGNKVVVVPTFGDPADQIALGILKEHFPTREIIGIHSVDLVWGLGAFHCITMQQVKV
jgi:agmatine deiminase